MGQIKSTSRSPLYILLLLFLVKLTLNLNFEMLFILRIFQDCVIIHWVLCICFSMNTFLLHFLFWSKDFMLHCQYFCRVDQKLSGENGNYNKAQATVIVGEIRQMQESLTKGEQEKQSLMQVCWLYVVISSYS